MIFVIVVMKSMVLNVRSWKVELRTDDKGKVRTGKKSMEKNLMGFAHEFWGYTKNFQL